jgi:hypothetical protein
VPQRRGAHPDRLGELGDGHRVRGPDVEQRLVGHRLGRLQRQAQLGPLVVQRGIRLLDQGQHPHGRVLVDRAHHPPGGDGSDRGGEVAVGERGVDVDPGVVAVARRAAGREREDPEPLEQAHLLHRVAGGPRDVDAPQGTLWTFAAPGCWSHVTTRHKHLNVTLEV